MKVGNRNRRALGVISAGFLPATDFIMEKRVQYKSRMVTRAAKKWAIVLAGGSDRGIGKYARRSC
jgi:hypothetical protein